MTATAAGGRPRASTLAAAANRPPNRLAERLTGRPYLSHSQLTLMRTCPRRFAFEYVEAAMLDFLPSGLLFGAAVHAALELHFRCQMEGLNATHAALLSVFLDAWVRQRDLTPDGAALPVRFNKGEDRESLFALAERVLRAFLASPAADPPGDVLGVEEELRVVLDPDLPDVLAKVDLVYADEGAVHVVDFKTSRSRWSDRRVSGAGEQLLLYGRTAAGLSDGLGLPVALHIVVLTKAVRPAVQVVDVPAEPWQLAAVRDRVAEAWRAITAGHFHPSPSPAHCRACPFRSRCPAFAR